MAVFDIKQFTNMIRKDYSNYVPEENLRKLEELWQEGSYERAYSKASVFCRRIPPRKQTDEFYTGIKAIEERTKLPAKSSISSSTSERKRLPGIDKMQHGARGNSHHEVPIIKEKDDHWHGRRANSPEVEVATLEYYIQVLARGICEQNLPDINCIQQTIPSGHRVYEHLTRIANTIEDWIKICTTLWLEREDARHEINRLTNELHQMDKGYNEKSIECDQFSKQIDQLCERLSELEAKNKSLRLAYMTKVETVERLESEMKLINERYIRQYQEQTKYGPEISRLTNHLQELNASYNEKSNQCGELSRDNTDLCKRVNEMKDELERMELTDINQRRIIQVLRERETAKNKYCPESYENKTTDVEKAERKIEELRDRLSKLTNELETKNIQLKKATKHLGDKEKEVEILQDQLEDVTKTSSRQDKSEALAKKIQHEKLVAEGKLRNANDKIHRLEKEITEKNRGNKELLQQNETQKQELKNIQVQIRDNDRTMENLRSRCEQLRKQYDQQNKDQLLLQSEEKRKNQHIQDLNQRLEDATRMKQGETEVVIEKLRYAKADAANSKATLQSMYEKQQRELQQIKSELKTSKEENEGNKTSKANLQSMFDRQETELKEIKSELQTLEEENRKYKRSYSRQQEKLEQYEGDIKRIQAEKQKKEQNITDLQRSKGNLQNMYDSQETDLKQIKSELQTMEEENRKYKRSYSRQQEKLEQYEEDIKRIQAEKQNNDQNIADLQRSSSRRQYEQDIGILQSQIQSKEKEIEDLKLRLSEAGQETRKIESLEQKVSDLKKENEEAVNKMKQIQNDNYRLQQDEEKRKYHEKTTGRTNKGYMDLQQQVEQLQNKVRTLNGALRQAQEKNEDLQNRFSKVAAAQLTHENPNIADLSDKNRPTKLAEAYSELYDNEWTEAFSAIEGDPGNTATEQDIVKQLRNILLSCFKQCTYISSRQMDSMKQLLVTPCTGSPTAHTKKELSTEHAKAINDVRKQTSPAAIKDIKEEMTKQYPESRKHAGVKAFVEKCAELCWLMVVQSPPVVIDDKHQTGDRFDKDVLKAYTKGGSTVDYVVWPPLYLHRGGPLLCKGTAQGK